MTYQIKASEIEDIRDLIEIVMDGYEVEEVIENDFCMTFEEVAKIHDDKSEDYSDRDLVYIGSSLSEVAILKQTSGTDEFGRDEQEHELQINMQKVEDGKVFFYIDTK